MLGSTQPAVFVGYQAFPLRLANGDGALPALIAAQRFRAASAIAFRPAALSRRLWRTGVLVDRGCAPSDMVGRLPLPGGRPRRLPLVPPRASIVRFNFS